MPRLLLLCEYPTLLGGERSMLATLPAVRQAGFEVGVACPPHSPLADALGKLSVETLAWQVRASASRRGGLAELRTLLARLMATFSPDLLHANSLSMARLSGPVAQSAAVPSLGHLRDIVRVSRQTIVDLHCHQRWIAVSRATAEFHQAQGLAAEKCSVIPNGVDLAEFAPRPATGYLHRELRLPPHARLMATIGQLGLRKGTDVALTAVRQVAQHRLDLHWLVVGSRTSRKAESRQFEATIRRAAAQAPTTGRVHFLGRRDDVPLLLNEIEMLLHAAHQEPLGRVLLEAAAVGVPVIATDVGGTPEIFPSERAGGVLVPPAEPAAMAREINRLLDDQTRRQALGEGGRLRAEEAFGAERAAQALIACYQELLTSR